MLKAVPKLSKFPVHGFDFEINSEINLEINTNKISNPILFLCILGSIKSKVLFVFYFVEGCSTLDRVSVEGVCVVLGGDVVPRVAKP